MNTEKFRLAYELTREIRLTEARIFSYTSAIDGVSAPSNQHSLDSMMAVLKQYMTYLEFRQFTIDWLIKLKLEQGQKLVELQQEFDNL